MFYNQHIFLCINERNNHQDCCVQRGSKPLLAHLKQRIRLLGEEKEKKIRVSNTGCLGRCKKGPVLVIYPDGIWYHYETPQDIDDIVDQHIRREQCVTRLLLPDV